MADLATHLDGSGAESELLRRIPVASALALGLWACRPSTGAAKFTAPTCAPRQRAKARSVQRPSRLHREKRTICPSQAPGGCPSLLGELLEVMEIKRPRPKLCTRTLQFLRGPDLSQSGENMFNAQSGAVNASRAAR